MLDREFETKNVAILREQLSKQPEVEFNDNWPRALILLDSTVAHFVKALGLHLEPTGTPMTSDFWSKGPEIVLPTFLEKQLMRRAITDPSGDTLNAMQRGLILELQNHVLLILSSFGPNPDLLVELCSGSLFEHVIGRFVYRGSPQKL